MLTRCSVPLHRASLFRTTHPPPSLSSATDCCCNCLEFPSFEIPCSLAALTFFCPFCFLHTLPALSFLVLQPRKKSLFYVFHNVFSVRVRVDGQEGKKSLAGVGWSKCLFPHMTEKISIPPPALCSENILTGSWAWLMQCSHYREADNCVLACNASNVTSQLSTMYTPICSH